MLFTSCSTPSRPCRRFKYFSKKTAFLGFVWCFVLSLLISWVMSLLAMLLLFTIFKYIDLSARSGNAKAKSTSGTIWGDVFDSVKYKMTTAILVRVTGTENFHAKNWRPQLLTFADTDEEGSPLSPEVLALAAQFRGGRGVNIVVSIKHGSYLQKGTFELSRHCSENLKKCMEKERLQVRSLAREGSSLLSFVSLRRLISSACSTLTGFLRSNIYA